MVRQVDRAKLLLNRMSMGRMSMGRGSMDRGGMGRSRPDVLTYCQCASQGTGHYGVLNDTAVLPRVLMSQGEILSHLSLTVPASKKNAEAKGQPLT